MTVAFFFILLLNCFVIFTADALLGAPPPFNNPASVIVVNGTMATTAAGVGGLGLPASHHLLAIAEPSMRASKSSSSGSAVTASSSASSLGSAGQKTMYDEAIGPLRSAAEHQSVKARKGVVDPPPPPSDAAVAAASAGAAAAVVSTATTTSSVHPLNATLEKAPTAPQTPATVTKVQNLRGDSSSPPSSTATPPPPPSQPSSINPSGITANATSDSAAKPSPPLQPSSSSTAANSTSGSTPTPTTSTASTSTTTPSTPTTSTTTTTTTTTTTAKPSKPKIVYTIDEDPNRPLIPPQPHSTLTAAEAAKLQYTAGTQSSQLSPPAEDEDEPRVAPSRELRLDEETERNVGRRYVIPIVTLIFAVPMILGVAIVLLRRVRNYLSTRHYRRVDFLVDGMYGS